MSDAPPAPAPRQPPRRRRSKWERVDPWALVAFLIFVGIVNVINRVAPAPPRAVPLPAATGSAPALRLSDYQPGDCLLGGITNGGPWPAVMHQVPCAQPHDYEVFYANSGYWPQDRPYPGDNAVQTQTNDQCASAYASYDGVPLSRSNHAELVIPPSRIAWHNGSRALECVVYDRNSRAPAGTALEMTGSIRHTRQ